MALKHWFCFLSACALAQPLLCHGQKSWRVFKLSDGLPESACISITVGPQGKVISRQLSQLTLCELDGYQVTSIGGLAPSSSRIYGSPAGQLWTAVPQGIQEYRDGAWILHPINEIAVENRGGLGRLIDPIPLCPVRQGVVLFLVSDKLMRLTIDESEHATVEVIRQSTQTSLGKFYAMVPSRDGGLWIGGARGLAKIPGPVRSLKTDAEWQEYLAPEPERYQGFQEIHEDEDGNVTTLSMITNSTQKVALQFNLQEWKTRVPQPDHVRHAWPGLEGAWWASTIEALYQYDRDRKEFVENEEISARQYFDLALEPGGVFWLATSEGLFRYSPLPWRSPSAVSKMASVVHGLTTGQDGGLWFVSGAELYRLSDGTLERFAFPGARRRSAPAVTAIYPLKDGTFLLNAGEEQMRFSPKNGTFLESGPGKAFKPLGVLKDRNLCVQIPAESPDEPCRIATFDGTTTVPLVDGPGIEMGHELTSAWSAQNGDLWISSDRGTAVYRDKKWKSFTSSDKSSPESVLWFSELPDGKIWCATSEAVWEFDGKNWSGLRRGFDRINGFLRTRDGSFWVASNSGIYRYVQGAWVDNGIDEGLPSGGIRDLCEDSRGRLWAGTTRGLSLYHPEADSDPPRTMINEIPERERNLPQGETLTIGFSGADKWKFTPADRLLFSYRLDDRDWSVFQPMNSVPFPELPAGKHYFQVRAMDRNGNVDPKPASLEFAVVVPWYKETRLVLISFTGMMVAIFFAALAFNRHRQLLRSYTEVEEKVAQRTRQLEMANRELAHSQKMTALGTLAAGIAHDFNNILSIIKGSAQIIEDNVDNPQKILTRADRIKTVVEQGSGIVKAMLGFTQDTDLQAGPCDINEVVEQTLKLLGDRFLREVEVRFEPGTNLPKIPCARDFLQQILLNFIFNAAEAMTERRQIVLTTTSLNTLPQAIVIPPAQAASYVAVSVKDSGCGIPQENMVRIFEPFFTTKALSARRGTGLGLSMVYELAKKMQAGLAVQSEVNQGSTFTVILPFLEKPNP